MDQRRHSGGPGLLAAGGIIGALLASSCCILPLLLVLFGLGGAWAGSLIALAPYQNAFAGFAALCLAAGFWLVYGKAEPDCDPLSACADPGRRRLIKGVLWLAATLLVLSLAANWLADRWL